jgi:hypothetical protein
MNQYLGGWYGLGKMIVQKAPQQSLLPETKYSLFDLHNYDVQVKWWSHCESKLMTPNHQYVIDYIFSDMVKVDSIHTFGACLILLIDYGQGTVTPSPNQNMFSVLNKTFEPGQILRFTLTCHQWAGGEPYSTE